MSTKTIVIGIIVILLIAAGAYFLMGNKSATPTPASQTGTTTQPVASGDQVQAQEVSAGTGKQAAPGSVVSVLYVGKLPDGTVFDSSEAHGNEPLKFQLGSQGLIAGFQVGVNGMKEGGERLIAIPPALGYGAQDVKDETGKVIIPANSTLIFDIKLVKVEDAPAAAPAAGTQQAN
ncbi:MAG: FKBP-type peptidyl-prolyl cis-trans isomerase [Candidatus Parcubacteria bacterium]|jgi:FKBP-type peptidyl-prolyl cis-trans isomerase